MLLLGLVPSVLGGVSWLLGGRRSPPDGQEVLSLSPNLGLGEGRKGRSHMHPGVPFVIGKGLGNTSVPLQTRCGAPCPHCS